MDRTYLQEAFQAMQLLEEEDFRLDDAGIKDILDFQNHDELNDIVDVVDPEAETEEKVKDSYVGNVVLVCEVCKSPIFKAPEDVVIEEGSDIANIQDECPICHSQDGFKIIGSICPYQEEPELKVEVEDKPVEEIIDDDDTEIDVDESLCETSALTEGRGRKANIYDLITKELYSAATGEHGGVDGRGHKIQGEETERYNNNQVLMGPTDNSIRVVAKTPEDLDFAKKVAKHFNADCTDVKELSKYNELKAGKYYVDITYKKGSSVTEAANICPECGKNPCECKKDNLTEDIDDTEVEIDTDIEESSEDKLEEVVEKVDEIAEKVEEIADAVIPEEVEENTDTVDTETNESLREGFEKIDLEMEDKVIHVSEEEKEPIPDAEMITPVSDELEAELMAPAEDETSVEEVPTKEVPVEDDLIDVEADDNEVVPDAAEDDTVDYDVDDFDEEQFDNLGESYLKNVYENVNSFKTTAVKANENSLIVEGLIKFDSGKEKATQFVFEAKDATKNGNVRFIGENAQITRGKKAFTLTGKMSGNKFIAESLNYNYRAQNNRVYGTVKADMRTK